jgi:hypothetical protein
MLLYRGDIRPDLVDGTIWNEAGRLDGLNTAREQQPATGRRKDPDKKQPPLFGKAGEREKPDDGEEHEDQTANNQDNGGPDQYAAICQLVGLLVQLGANQAHLGLKEMNNLLEDAGHELDD